MIKSCHSFLFIQQAYFASVDNFEFVARFTFAIQLKWISADLFTVYMNQFAC